MSSSSSSIRAKLAALDIQRKSLECEAEAITNGKSVIYTCIASFTYIFIFFDLYFLNDFFLELTTSIDGETRPMGIDTPLIDEEGYPRNDIDVHRARTLRHRLAVIRTDHKELMKEVELNLIRFSGALNHHNNEKDEEEEARRATKPKPKFDAVTGKWVVMNWDGTVAGDLTDGEKRKFNDVTDAAAAVSNNMNMDDICSDRLGKISMSDKNDNSKPPPLIPFAVVDSVSLDSPASESGLREGDLITELGCVNYYNHRNLKAIATLVPQAAATNQAIGITVLRRRRMSIEHDIPHSVEAGEHVTVQLSIRPRPWNGRGLIGCHIVDYDPAAYNEPHQG